MLEWQGSEKSEDPAPLLPAHGDSEGFSKQDIPMTIWKMPVFQFGTLRLGDSKLSLPLSLPTTYSLLKPQIVSGFLLTSSTSILNSLWVFNFLFLRMYTTGINTWQKSQRWLINTTVAYIGKPGTWHLLQYERSIKSEPLPAPFTLCWLCPDLQTHTWAVFVSSLPYSANSSEMRRLCF
jgi:hypothetical protein